MLRDGTPMATAFAVDWQALSKLLPTGQGVDSIAAREALFKELVVRADHLKERVGTKVGHFKFKGTLALFEAEKGLAAVFKRTGAVSLRPNGTFTPDLARLVGLAFRAARGCVQPVTGLGEFHIEMNEFHALTLYFVLYLDICENILPEGQAAAPALGGPRGGRGREFEDARATFARLLAETNTSFSGIQAPFDELADRCLCRLLRDWAAAATAAEANAEADCRKRAFQLLQALNNTPSLPNSVPGPIDPNADTDYDVAIDLNLAGGVLRFVTTNQRLFQVPSRRDDELTVPHLSAYFNLTDRGVRPTSTLAMSKVAPPPPCRSPRALRAAGSIIASPRLGPE